MTATSDTFKDIVPPLLHPPLPSPTFTMFAPPQILIQLGECAAAIVEPHPKKSSLGSITFRSRSRQICPSLTYRAELLRQRLGAESNFWPRAIGEQFWLGKSDQHKCHKKR